jgi:transcriptional regulator with XRE-family HTH domain
MRDTREASGLSVEEVAKALSLSPSSVRQWERGHQFPSRDNMEEFAEATNVDMVWLITGYESTR